MKRNRHLIPLSHDHHHGLLFCRKIRQGIKLKVHTERICKYIQLYWQQYLQKHFYEEETLLFVVKDTFCQVAVREHRAIQQQIKQIMNSSPDAGLLQSLADLVDHHIRYEERILFPHLEKILTEKTLTGIGRKLQRLHTNSPADNYQDIFWPNPKA